MHAKASLHFAHKKWRNGFPAVPSVPYWVFDTIRSMDDELHFHSCLSKKVMKCPSTPCRPPKTQPHSADRSAQPTIALPKITSVHILYASYFFHCFVSLLFIFILWIRLRRFRRTYFLLPILQKFMKSFCFPGIVS